MEHDEGMTVNELIAALQRLADDGHGEMVVVSWRGAVEGVGLSQSANGSRDLDALEVWLG